MGLWKSIREVLNNRIEDTPAPAPIEDASAERVIVRRERGERPAWVSTYESPHLPSELWGELLQIRDGRFPLGLNFGRGFLVERTTGKFVNVGNRHLRALGIWSCKVRGDRYYPGEMWPGRPVTLVREPDNPHDKNAIAILNDRGEQVGHWNKGMAPGLAKLLDAGADIQAVALDRDPPKVIAAEASVMAQLRA